MARKKTEKKSEAGGFGKMFAWTVVLGIVFSAGLITGQRLLRKQAMAPMVSLSTTRAAAEPAADADGKPGEPAALRTTFSFYEHLTAQPSISAAPAPKKDAPKAAPAEAKPAEVEAKPAEAKPAEAKPTAVAAAEPEPKPAPVEKVAAAAVPKPAVSSVGEAVDTLQKAVESLTDEPAEALPARYTLQVSSHPDRDSAEKELGRLRQVGVEPHVVAVDVPGKGKLFRIRVGKFHSMDEAREFQGSLKHKRGVAGFVTPL